MDHTWPWFRLQVHSIAGLGWVVGTGCILVDMKVPGLRNSDSFQRFRTVRWANSRSIAGSHLDRYKRSEA